MRRLIHINLIIHASRHFVSKNI